MFAKWTDAVGSFAMLLRITGHTGWPAHSLHSMPMSPRCSRNWRRMRCVCVHAWWSRAYVDVSSCRLRCLLVRVTERVTSAGDVTQHALQPASSFYSIHFMSYFNFWTPNVSYPNLFVTRRFVQGKMLRRTRWTDSWWHLADSRRWRPSETGTQ